MTKDESKEQTREEKLLSIVKNLNKEYGDGTIIINGAIPSVERFSSGCLSLDIALGGGWPRGRIIELLGDESSGKTSVSYQAIAEIQKLGGVAALVDAECATDPLYLQALGVNIDSLVFSQPTSGEEALDIVAELAENAVVDLIIVDSVAALVPKAEKDAESIGDQQMGLHPRLMSKAMRILTGPASKSNTTIIFTNQWREKMSLYGGKVATGGNALKYYATQRVALSRSDNKPVMEEDQAVGTSIKARVIKNKVSPPFREADFVIRYGQGIDRTLDILRTALIRGLIVKAGAWYSYGDTRIGQGEKNSCDFLLNNPEVVADIVKKILP